MNEIKKFIKNEDDNWEEYKDLINEDTKFMMFDGKNAKELSVSETIHQLRLDNKYLELQIINLQSKIDKAIKYIENNLLPSHSIEKTDWEFEEVIFSDLPVERIKPLIDILKEDK